MQQNNIHLFYGDEDFLIEQEICSVKRRLLEKDKSISAEYFSADTAEAPQLAAEIFTQSLFSKDRLLVISGYDDDVYLGILESSSKIPQGTVVVISEPSVDKRTKFFKKALTSASVKEFKTFAQWETDRLISWIKERVSSLGKKIGSEAALLLNEISGPSLRQISSEIEKLSTFAGKREEITAEDVKTLAVSGELEAFAIENAVASRDIDAALSSLAAMMRSREKAEMIIGKIASRLRLYLQISSLKSLGLTRNESIKKTGMNPYYFERCEKSARLYSTGELLKAAKKLSEADMDLKTTMKPDDLVMQTLLIDILLKEGK